MRKLYGSTSWRRVLALVLVFVMMFSIMGTSGYSVFAEGLEETGEAVVEPAAEEPAQEEEFTPQGESPGTEEADVTELVEVTEEENEAEDAVTEAEEGEDENLPETDEEAAEDENGEEPAEPVEEEAAEGEELEAEPAEEAEEEVEEPAEESEEEADVETEETLIAEAAQIIEGDDGEAAPAEEVKEEVAEEAAEEELAEAEELPEEELLEEAVAMPAIEADEDFKDARVYVYAPEGAFFEGTTVEIKAVKLGRTQVAAVAGAIEENVADYVAYDITFYDAEGAEAQPALPVTVNIEPKKLAEPENLQVVHMEDEKSAQKIAADATEEGLAFDAKHFSVYVVVETVVPRLTVKFMNGETEIASMIIKKADTADEVAEIIYDPGVGTVPEGLTFKGWTTEGATNLLTIANVRADAMAKVAELSKDGEVTYTAVYYKQYTITYVTYADGKEIAVGMEAADLPSTETNVDYIVNMAYSTDDTHNFEGWTVASKSISSIVSPENITAETIIENETPIVIKGDVTFIVVAPEGRWLVFDENGKGASYVAPQFVKAGENTKVPTIEMARNGYTFGGWYDSKDNAEAHAEDPDVVTGEFEFGSPLPETKTIYASWIPNTTANYAVVFWTQDLNVNAAEKTYEVAGSYTGTGNVGQPIPFTPVENGAEDYVSGFGMKANDAYPDNPEHPAEIDKGHFIGFCLTEDSKDQQVLITPEGDAVLNLYYDRILYNFKFYLYKDGNGANQYSYANMSGSGRYYAVENQDDTLVTWHNNQNAHPDVTGYSMLSETLGDGRTYHYFVMQAYYGEDISNKWPTYSMISGANNRDPVSYVMMVGTKLKPKPSSGGDGTVKGVISVMNENILGKPNDANGNYVVVRFPGGTVYDWRYHIWLETAAGEDYGEAPIYEYNGRTYYQSDVMSVRSSNTNDDAQNEPKYIGFDYVTRLGQNPQGVWGGGHWTTNNPALYHLNYIYNRQQYRISYFDGNYINAKNESLDNRASHLLHESTLIGQGVPIADEYKEYVPDLPDGQDGYVFDGWYMDEGCSVPYTWTKMPIGGIKVYAKWRQVQYRVFLHPNANVSLPIDWGKAEDGSAPSMCFRLDYGKQISAPTGVQVGYEFYGWYWPDGSVFNESTKIKSGTEYDKESVYTDPIDEYGVVGDNPTNADIDRFWVTGRVDLYAKWGEIIVGADGINVVYDAGDGTNAPTDSALHKDNTPVGAGPAATAPEGKVFDHWMIQKWDGSAYAVTNKTVLPGVTFNVLKSDAKITLTGTDTVVAPTAVTDDGKYDYTVQLKAVYKDIGEKTPTHIGWYSNYGEENGGKGEQYRYDTLDEAGNPTLGINVGVDILAAPSRPGYVFKGWTKTQGGTTADFLIWTENGYTDVDGNAATQVAADEKQNQGKYEDLFAVWEEGQVTINYEVAEDSTGMGTVALNVTGSTANEETVYVFSGKHEDGSDIYGGKATATGNYEFAYWTVDKGTESISTNATYIPEMEGDPAAYVAHTYYAHFKVQDATVTVYHFLKGTETPVADNTTMSMPIGSTVDPENVAAATTFLETFADLKPTKDSTVPTGAVEVTANGAQITLYYTLPLKITAKPDSKKYDGQPLVGAYTIEGALAADEDTVKTALGDAPSITEVGSLTYPNEETQVGVTADIPGYYAVTFVPGTLTITEDDTPVTYAIIYHSNYKSVVETAEEAPDYTDDPATVILGPDAVGFSTGLQKTIGEKTYKFVKWTVMPDGTGAEFKPDNAYNGEGAVLPQQDDANGTAGTASAVSTSAKSIRAMVATSSNGGTLNLYAQWEEVQDDTPTTPDNPPRPRPNPDPDPIPGPTEEDTEIDDGDTPLAPAEEEDTEIDDGDTPLAPAEEEDTEIDEEATPLSPFTGDERHTAVWGFVSLLSLAGIVVVARKRREE